MTDEPNVQLHTILLQQLTDEYPNSVCILASPHPIDRYTCLMYVFDFTEKPEYIDIARYPGFNVYAGANFVYWLIDRRFLTEISEVNARTGDLLMYFNGCDFKHVGILRESKRVISKWGIGHLYEHGLWEVPLSYGTTLRFFRSITYERAFDLFTYFAEENGIPFETPDP